LYGGGHWGGSQNRNTAKKIGKNRNTASKIDRIPKPHFEMPFIVYHKLHLAILLALNKLREVFVLLAKFHAK